LSPAAQRFVDIAVDVGAKLSAQMRERMPTVATA
jgi:hypothetical protein